MVPLDTVETLVNVEFQKRRRVVCRSPRRLMVAGSGTEIELVLELFRQDVDYATPKVDIRVSHLPGWAHFARLVREISVDRRPEATL
jgi:hypothetical protein